jgi:uncharacterized MAPEG superfamily protein
VVFAPLVLVVVLTGTGTALTATAAAAYFFLRLAHYLIHTAAVPVLRTVVFLGGWLCQMILGLTVLGLL